MPPPKKKTPKKTPKKPPTKKTLGEALGELVATVVDGAISHCEAVKAAYPGTPGGVIVGKKGPDPDGEVTWTIGVELGCAPGNTGTPGETMINFTVPTNYPSGVTLGAPQMTRLLPGKAIPTSSYQATAPTHAAMGSNALRVSISAANPQGLYLGELRATTNSGAAGPTCPVVIYLDGLP